MESTGLILGLDIGVRSIGWALIDLHGKTIKGMGVRLFEAGVTNPPKMKASVDNVMKQGLEQSNAAARRIARSARKNNYRRVYRQVKLACLLQNAGLFPEGKVSNSAARHQLIGDLDRQIGESYSSAERGKLPYTLRAAALHEKLEPFELGRAIYHLAQRRGFKSNRKSAAKADEKQGKVKPAIHELEKKIISVGAETLGEYLAMQDSPKVALRKQYTSRDMYLVEFESMWSEQAKHHPDILTAELKATVSDAIFFQRPLKSQAHLVGKCHLEREEMRAPKAIRIAQRFRLLETVNRLRIIEADGARVSLTPEQRAILVEKLDTEKRVSFMEIRKWLKFNDDVKINLETEGTKSLRGNPTGAMLASIFLIKKWNKLTEQEKESIFDTFFTAEDEAELIRIAIQEWGLDQKKANKLAGSSPERGYYKLSVKAIRELMPFLENGDDLESAIRNHPVYKLCRQAQEAVPSLPPVLSVTDINNPSVIRALSEVRRLVNSEIGDFGLPDVIRVELARDMRRNREERQFISKEQSINESKRRKASEALKEDRFGLTDPSDRDIDKYLLWMESDTRCIYCGREIAGTSLLTGATHVDHIIPRKISHDSSIVNKVLCHADCNEYKGARTPHEAYSHNEADWNRIIDFAKDRISSEEKLKRIKMTRNEAEEFYSSFTNSQLCDTQHTSRAVGDYLGLLYGGRIDEHGTTRVQMTKGGITSEMRNALQLASIAPMIVDWVFDPKKKHGKDRGDHRHHAIDALAIALSSPSIVKLISEAYGAADTVKKDKKKEVWIEFARNAAWSGFLDDAIAALKKTKISYRARHRVRGKLFHDNPVKESSAKRNSGDIGDAYIRVGKDSAHSRLLKSAGNHHIEIFKVTDNKGREKWEGRAVTLHEAHQRVNGDRPVVDRHYGPHAEFMFSLYLGDTIELTEGEERKLYHVCSIWEDRPGNCRIDYKPINDATTARCSNISLGPLRDLGCKKVTVDALGKVQYHRD